MSKYKYIPAFKKKAGIYLYFSFYNIEKFFETFKQLMVNYK